jgi:hypothetical protein
MSSSAHHPRNRRRDHVVGDARVLTNLSDNREGLPQGGRRSDRMSGRVPPDQTLCHVGLR